VLDLIYNITGAVSATVNEIITFHHNFTAAALIGDKFQLPQADPRDAPTVSQTCL